MTQREKVKFRITDIEPNPKEVDWWIDLSTNEYGGCIRYYREDTESWELLNLNDQHLQQLLDYLDGLIAELEDELGDGLGSFKTEIQDQINQLKQQVQQIQSSIQNMQSSIDSINQSITNLTQQITDLDTKITNLTTQFNQYKQELTEQFNSLKQELQQSIQQKLDQFDEQITQVTGSQLTLESIQNALSLSDGTKVTLNFETGKIKLPLWTGTLTEYNAIGTKTRGVTYNIIEEGAS